MVKLLLLPGRPLRLDHQSTLSFVVDAEVAEFQAEFLETAGLRPRS
jgi:hypothetical protein